MGSHSFRSDDWDREMCVNISHFKIHHTIGKGCFCRVWLAKHKTTKQIYALKEILKSRVIAQKHVGAALNEQTILSTIRHPFLVNMHHAFQSRDYLFLTLDLKTGGDLRYHLLNHTFVEEEARFMISCVILTLEYLHSNKIIHRDLKPENWLLDEDGYVCLTDFGIARKLENETCREMSGTPGYMAPEVLCQESHTYTADWFAIGVILYEIITGLRPYVGKNMNQIKNQILDRQIQLKHENLSGDWSKECVDFVNKLIQREPQNRLGFKGVSEVKNHPWVKNVEWEKLLRKEVAPVFKPPKANNFNHKYVSEEWRDGIVAKSDYNQEAFKGYFYNEMSQGDKVESNHHDLHSRRKYNLCQLWK
ncbi:unnamed protein product [Blepharisma stoltei]|uniref:Protein kinase domain-containing protein n=1 Tax=Blepharisma stoltei TaxID=1481888 RepID=A0AAU9JLX7_9CILI|nr:unnamed protein product [Blepharisma stoltei]